MFRRSWEWYKARQRGEVRIAKYGVTGRVFAKLDPNTVVTSAGDDFITKNHGRAELSARIIRKDGTIEEL